MRVKLRVFVYNDHYVSGLIKCIATADKERHEEQSVEDYSDSVKSSRQFDDVSDH